MFDNMNKMIRYNGPRRNRRKNCLVTLCDGKNIFFGISRCNIKEDDYSRKVGKSLALGRATGSMNKDAPNAVMYIDSDGLSGRCSVANTKFLLRYFESLR